ncbi:MAG: hypothetical protein E7597_06855 [Ruminococcaceae bacterium]|nr:hypothetical protein [Oscillospiraceae bacterium]
MAFIKSLGPLAIAAVFVFCLFNSTALAESSRQYLVLCGQKVVPSLFVFSVLGALVSQGEGLSKLCRRLPLWGTETAVLLLSLCGGVPLGPLTAAELYRSGSLNKRQAEYLCTFSCTPSLSFIISFVGGVLGGNKGTTLAILYAGVSVLTAVICKPLMLNPEERRLIPTVAPKSKTFSTVLANSATSSVVICGCVVFFGTMATMLPRTAGGFLEISAGIANCRSDVEAAVLLGFSGFSIFFQASAAVDGELSLKPCFGAKLFQAVLMGTLAYFIID